MAEASAGAAASDAGAALPQSAADPSVQASPAVGDNGPRPGAASPAATDAQQPLAVADAKPHIAAGATAAVGADSTTPATCSTPRTIRKKLDELQFRSQALTEEGTRFQAACEEATDDVAEKLLRHRELQAEVGNLDRAVAEEQKEVSARAADVHKAECDRIKADAELAGALRAVEDLQEQLARCHERLKMTDAAKAKAEEMKKLQRDRLEQLEARRKETAERCVEAKRIALQEYDRLKAIGDSAGIMISERLTALLPEPPARKQHGRSPVGGLDTPSGGAAAAAPSRAGGAILDSSPPASTPAPVRGRDPAPASATRPQAQDAPAKGKPAGTPAGVSTAAVSKPPASNGNGNGSGAAKEFASPPPTTVSSGGVSGRPGRAQPSNHQPIFSNARNEGESQYDDDEAGQTQVLMQTQPAYYDNAPAPAASAPSNGIITTNNTTGNGGSGSGSAAKRGRADAAAAVAAFGGISAIVPGDEAALPRGSSKRSRGATGVTGAPEGPPSSALGKAAVKAAAVPKVGPALTGPPGGGSNKKQQPRKPEPAEAGEYVDLMNDD